MPEQQIDPELLAQTRREISKLLIEIEELAGRDIPVGEFYAEFLRRVASALAANATALWIRTPQGNLQLQYQTNLQIIGLDANPFVRQGHDELLRYGVTESKGMILAPRCGPGEGLEEAPVNPTDFLIVLAPIVIDGATVGIIEVFQDGARRASAHEGYLRFLTRIAAEAGRFVRNRQFRQLVGQQELWNDIETYIRVVHGGLHPKQVAYLIANEGRKVIQCERVSVALKRRKKTVIEAISGQDVVERRSNLVYRMSKLADRVIRHGENVIYSGVIEAHWPGDIALALEHYLEESGSKLVAVIPLEDQREFGGKGRATAALVIEMIEDHAPADEMAGRIEVVSRHGAVALHNALEHHRVFLLPLWRTVGNATQWLTGRALPKVVAAVALLVALTATMVFVPWPLRLEGKGELVPEIRRHIYAPRDGVVKAVKVDRGDEVDEMSTLVEMSNPELELELERLKGEQRTTERVLQTLRAQESSRNDPDLGTKISEAEQKRASLEQQVRLLEEQRERLQIKSPIHGRVMDWKPQEKLLSRPVKQGDVLLEVADVAGPWILEVKLPEDTITHIARARAESKDGTLPVTYVISASPDRTYRGTLYQVSTQAQAVDQANVVEARISLDSEDATPPLLGELAGVEVRAKVDCGPHSLGYVLFRELIDFVREYVFF